MLKPRIQGPFLAYSRRIWMSAAALSLMIAAGVWMQRREKQMRLDEALIEAIKHNDAASAIVLLKEGADGNASDGPPTHSSLRSRASDLWKRLTGQAPWSGTYRPCALLVLYGVEFYYTPDGEAETTGYQPKRHDSPALVEALIEHGANPNVIGFGGQSVLYDACRYHHTASVKVLLDHGVKPGVKENNGMNPLEAADADTARLLIRYGAKVLSRDSFGMTALDYTYRRNDKDWIRVLEEAAAKERAVVFKHKGV